MNSESEANLAKAYREWVDTRAGEAPSFEALAPKPSPRSRILTFPRAVAALAAAAALMISIVTISHLTKPAPAAADDELAMPWPSETDFLLTWSDTPIYLDLIKQPK